jgi:hypothetical protein
MIELMPGVEQANSISEELDKKLKFELMCVSPEARGELTGRTEVSYLPLLRYFPLVSYIPLQINFDPDFSTKYYSANSLLMWSIRAANSQINQCVRF